MKRKSAGNFKKGEGPGQDFRKQKGEARKGHRSLPTKKKRECDHAQEEGTL